LSIDYSGRRGVAVVTWKIGMVVGRSTGDVLGDSSGDVY